MTSIFICLAAAAVIMINGVYFHETLAEEREESPAVTAQASAMPNQGWAPLTVYFSAHGSSSEGASIVRYEWDLDGDGSFDFDATAQGGYAHYLYSKTGERTITLRVTDSLGRFATDRVTVSVRHPASSSVDYWSIFDDSRVKRIDISLSGADWSRIWAEPGAKYQARAGALIFGRRLQDVGFSMRGQFSLHASGDKKPWKIDIDAFIEGQEFQNLKQLLLVNNVGDHTLLKEKLAYEMLAFAGLPASHTAFVELWIDIYDDDAPPLYWGVYTLIERVDNKYLANRFGRECRGGNLYKASHARRGPMDLMYYGEAITDYPTQNGEYAYGKMNNEAEADYSDIIALCRVLNTDYHNDEEAFTDALESIFNVDAFLRYMAVTVILDNGDSYPNTGNNYYLFNNSVSGRLEWIPWDLTWGMNPTAPLFGRHGELVSEHAPLYEKVFGVERYRRQYTAYVDLLLRHHFNPDHIAARAGKYHRMIAPHVTKSTGDKAYFGELPMFRPEDFNDSWRELVEFTARRSDFLRDHLRESADGI